jgi:hypothetical protein
MLHNYTLLYVTMRRVQPRFIPAPHVGCKASLKIAAREGILAILFVRYQLSLNNAGGCVRSHRPMCPLRLILYIARAISVLFGLTKEAGCDWRAAGGEYERTTIHRVDRGRRA